MNQKIHIILSTSSIGGAENRFVGLWLALCESHPDLPVFLVIDPQLYNLLQQQEDITERLTRFQKKVIQFNLNGNFKKFRLGIKQFITAHTNSGDILHFIGDHPLLSLKKNKQVYSITQSSLKNLNLAGKAGQVLGIYYSDLVDILDPKIYARMIKIFFYKKSRISQTSNSFCDLNLFFSQTFSQKKDWLVFLGRFEPMKQVKQLLDAVPLIYKSLRDNAGNDLHFYFFGYGSQEGELIKMLQEERFQGLPVTVMYNKKPNEILALSKVFFSLQLHNNYPSKSLIEAMAAGNIPVVTDIGQTRWLAKPEFSYYVTEKFTTQEIVMAVKKIYNESEAVLTRKSEAARQFVMEEHTIEKMVEYYLRLYQSCIK